MKPIFLPKVEDKTIQHQIITNAGLDNTKSNDHSFNKVNTIELEEPTHVQEKFNARMRSGNCC